MRWFCGFIPREKISKEAFAKPILGKNIWDEVDPLWVCGTWAKSEVIAVTEGSIRVAILGRCIAPYENVVKLISEAIRSNDYNRLARLPGNYNILIKDRADAYIFTDSASLRPIFYVVYDSFVIYSSFSIALHKLTGAKLNQHWLATYLISASRMPELLQSQSPFHGIETIPPSHVLQVSPEEVICKKYCNQPQGDINVQEAAEQLRKHLLTTIELRVDLQESITSDLSGGVDSTSLSLISAKKLATRGQGLHTITVEGLAATGNEDTERARHAAGLYPNIRHVLVKRHEYPEPFSSLEEIPLTDEPTAIVLVMNRFQHVLEVVRSRGSQLHISGEGGDAVLSAPTSYLADLVRRRKIKTFIQHSYGWARVFHSSLVPVVNNAIRLSTTSYCRWLSQQTRQLASGKMHQEQSSGLNLGWSGSISYANWYTRETAELAVLRLMQYMSLAVPFSDYPGQHSSIVSIHGAGRLARAQQQIADFYGVNIDFPYLDALVIEACLQAKVEERTTPFMYKPLLYQALHRDLPKSVLTRDTKCDYTAELYAGLRKNIVEFSELFQSSYLSDMGLINLKGFQAAINSFSMGLSVGLGQFNGTIALELWLRRLLASNCSQFWE